MMSVPPLLLLFSFLVEVYGQTVPAPYLTFNGQTLANHSYVDLSLVGGDDSGSDSVQCHTDLGICCSGAQGPHRGDWYSPGSTDRLPFSDVAGNIFEQRLDRRVDLRRRNSATSPVGIYSCDIPTDAVHDDTDISVRDTVYVGLYTASGGDISISGNLTFDSDQLSLTCISTGGPATTVTWNRDDSNITGEQNETVLNDPETAQYTHTLKLTVAGVGVYTCTVSNNKPSSATSASITMLGASPPTNVTAVQDGLTSIRVTWSPPSPLGDTTGYRISFTGAGNSDSVDFTGGLTNSYILTNLINGVTYTIFIVATSLFLPSVTVTGDMAVGLVPGPPTIGLVSATATTISLSLSVPSGSVVTKYLVEWQRDTSVGCSDEDEDNDTITDGSTSYNIGGLEEDSRYDITVTASNTAGSSVVSNSVTAVTKEAAPSAPPSSVTVTGVTSSTISVQWRSVPCIHQNGDITGYSVQYEEIGSGKAQTVPVPGATTTQTNISGLTPSTNYSVQVAAESAGGIGVYSNPVFEHTTPSPPTDVTAVQDGPTSIIVAWSPSIGATGYSIQYDSSGGHSGSETIGGNDTGSWSLTGLQNGQTYTIFIEATYKDRSSHAIQVEVILIPAPGEVLVSVSSITASSISLSWSVASGRVASWEVVWRPTDRGTESTSGSLPGNTYTIHQLDSPTIYTVTVRATNVAGTTNSTPILFSTVPSTSNTCETDAELDTNSNSCDSCSETDNTAGIIGGIVAVAVVLILSITTAVTVIVLAKKCSKGCKTKEKRGKATIIPNTEEETLKLSKVTTEENVHPDEFLTTGNEAYSVVQRSGGTYDEYEAVSAPRQDLPPSSSTSQPTTTTAPDGDFLYEPV